jgi:hyaluronan synthase
MSPPYPGQVIAENTVSHYRDCHEQPLDGVLRFLIVVLMVLIAFLAIRFRLLQPLLHDLGESTLASFLLIPAMVWICFCLMLLALRTFLWFTYRAPPLAGENEAMPLTVIIPAYNEGPMVAQSIDSVASARYPRDKLEILVVDDGSTDDTWTHIEAAAKRHPGLVTTVRFPKNRGKRAGLETGFRRARGEIVVTIDSDSVIDADTLLAMAGAFRNPDVGAVAGKVTVFNEKGLIPRMLKVRYALSFDFLRATQSTYQTVFCCPGALAGYRLSVVREVLDEWMAQTFMGVPCTYGEDRSMTNYIIRQGYKSLYQRAAVVRTLVPHQYGKLCKMFLRWDRSYVREEIRFAAILWRLPLRARLMSLFELIIAGLRFPIGWVSLVALLLVSLHDPSILAKVVLIIFAVSCFNMLYYLRAERSWDFIYGIIYAYYATLVLFWVFPYAVCTVREQSWMTR